MKVEQLRYFVEIVESGSLSKASRRLNIVQPALSQRMTQLEAEVGKTLLIRSAQGVTPTENGKALYLHAKFVLRQFDIALQIARREYTDVQGNVTVGLAPSTAGILGLPLLQAIKAKYPQIQLGLIVALPRLLAERARQNQLDVGILFDRNAAHDYEFEPLVEEEIFLVMRADSDLIGVDRTQVGLAEVARLPLVMAGESNDLRRRISSAFQYVGLAESVVTEIDSLELVMRHVAEIGGATIQPMAATRALGATVAWRCVSIEQMLWRRPNYLFTLPRTKLSIAAAAVRDEIKILVEALIADGTWFGVSRAN